MKATLGTALLAVVLVVPVSVGQTVTVGTGTLTNTSFAYPSPYGNTYSGARSQYLIRASELQAAGMPTAAGPSSLGFDVVQIAGQALQLFEIRMALTTAQDLSGGWDPAAMTTVFGPQTYQDVVGWNDHQLSGAPGWDGVSSIVIEVCFWNGTYNWSANAVVNQTATSFTSGLSEWDDQNPPCGFPGTFVQSHQQRPNMRFGFFGAVWQSNTPEASFDIDGAIGTATAVARVTRAVGEPFVANLNSTLVGQAFDVAVTVPGPLVPPGAGGIPTAGGQVVNVNLASPGLIYFFNFAPFQGSMALPFVSPSPIDLAAQMVVLNPMHADGFSLSQGVEFMAIVCPTSENFDSLPVGVGNYPAGWADGGGQQQWRVNTGGTPLGSPLITGPTAASSLPNYMYCETSGALATTFIMDTCTVDLSQLSSLAVNFNLSRIGATVGTLRVLQDDGTGTFPFVLGTFTGPDPTQSQGGVEWSPVSLPITVGTWVFAKFRFEYTSGMGFTGDIAIDDLLLQ